MSCTKTNSIDKWSLLHIIAPVAKTQKQLDIYTSYLTEGSRFLEYISNKLFNGENKTLEELFNLIKEDAGNKSENSISNKLRKEIQHYYNNEHRDVRNHISKNLETVFHDYTSATAKFKIRDYIASQIRFEYLRQLSLPSNERLTAEEILKGISESIKAGIFTNVAIPFIDTILENKLYQGKEYIDFANEDGAKIKLIDEFVNLRNKKSSEEFTEEDNNRLKEIQSIFKKENITGETIPDLKMRVIEFMSTHGTDAIKNNVALYREILRNEKAVFSFVLKSKLATEINSEFNKALDTLSVSDGDKDGIDIEEEATSLNAGWDKSNVASDYRDAISSSLKIRLGSYYKLETPATEDNLNYKIDEEIGYPTLMSSGFVISQIKSYGDFSSVDNLIASLDKVSKVNPSLYGLGALVLDMKRDRTIANKIAHELSATMISKMILDVSEAGVKFIHSNKSADATLSLAFDMTNQIRQSFETSYNTNTKFILEELKDKFNNSRYEISDKDKIELKNIIKSIFPDFTEQSISSLLDNVNRNDLLTVIDGLLNIDKALLNMNEEKSEIDKKYKEELEKYFSSNRQGDFPIKDFEETKGFKDAKTAVSKISSILSQYIPSNIEFNSFNAEGKMASDLIAISFITSISHLVNTKSVDKNTGKIVQTGLINFGNYITQDKKLYNHPLFFGIDEKGGMFIKTNDGFEVSPEAAKYFNLYLYDGTTNSTTGESAMYTDLSNADYIYTMLSAFFNPNDLYIDGKVVDRNTQAIYFPRTPSDAPKTFGIQSIKYSIKNTFIVNNDKIIENVIKGKVKLLSKLGYVKSGELKILSNKHYNIKDFEELIKDITTKDKSKLFTYLLNKDNNFVINVVGNDKIATRKLKVVNENGEELIVEIKAKFDNKEKTGEMIGITIHSPYGLDNIDSILYKFYKNNIEDNIDKYTEEVLSNGLDIEVSKTSDIHKAITKHMIMDLDLFINQLNKVFDISKVKDKIKFTSKKNVDGLYFNAQQSKGKVVIDKNGQNVLAGGFFSFGKLFKFDGIDFDPEQEIFNLINVYGKNSNSKALLTNDKDGLKINTEHEFIHLNGEKIELALPNNFEELIEPIISKWLKQYREYIIKQYKNVELINNSVGTEFTKYSVNQFVEAFINYAIMGMNYDDLFDGHPGFYKGPRDIFKRAKQEQASGKSYSSRNLDEQIDAPISDLLDSNNNPIELSITLETQEENGVFRETSKLYYPSINEKGELVYDNKTPIRQRNGFRAITVAGSTVSNILNPNGDDVHTKLLIEAQREEYTRIYGEKAEEELEKLAAKIISGYNSGTKINDAQSYITYEEWIRRIEQSGNLDKYKHVIKAIDELNRKYQEDPNYKPNEQLLKDLNAAIQVQKNIYYDKHYDKFTEIHAGRQIKNAEFVIVPALVKGTQLEEVYKLMIKHNIDQINTGETSKAAKRSLPILFDNNGELQKEQFENYISQPVGENDASSLEIIEPMYYRFLYQQQEVPNHHRDTKNKIAVQVMKKVADNPTSKTASMIDDLFNLYVENIKESYETFINEMGWKVLSDGSIVDINYNPDDPDSTSYIKFEEFYKRALEEGIRLGLDSNFLEYFTTDEFGNPVMPNFMSPVSSKLENIFQSIFNNKITKQELPGWHAAQVTGVGIGVDENGVRRELQYHPAKFNEDGSLESQAIIEIMLPRNSELLNNINIKELEEGGIDLHIGYRIPTEGKQSIAVMKVVGFLPDYYGSTVIVPHAWVTQTGSDFDVDSVYAISKELTKDSKGKPIAYKYDDGLKEKDYKRRYIKYIERKAKDRSTAIKSLKEKIESINKDIKDKINELFDNNSEEFNILKQLDDEKYELLPDYVKSELINKNKEIITKYKPLVESGKIARHEFYAIQLGEHIDILNKAFNEAKSENIKSKIQESIDVKYQLIDNLDYETLNEEKYKLLEDKVTLLDYRFEKAKELANESNLIEFEDFIQLPLYKQNDRKARNNKMVDLLIQIMQHPDNLAENWSRSNFDEITKYKRYTSDISGASSELESVYNPFTQAKYTADAISGRTLKGISVADSSMCSICNVMKTNLSNSDRIIIEYDTSISKVDDDGKPVEGVAYSEETIRANIIGDGSSDNQITVKDNIIRVTHSTFGWSPSNRGVNGDLITVSSSFATAYILDIVKEGALKNVNQYSIGAFKMFANIGSDYRVAIAFMSQPGVTAVINAYDKNNSVYLPNNGENVYEQSIKELLNKISIELYDIEKGNRGIQINDKFINRYTNFYSIRRLLNSIGKDYNIDLIRERAKAIFGNNFNPKVGLLQQNLPINIGLLEKRLRGENLASTQAQPELDNLIFDLFVAQQFENIRQTAAKISNLANYVKTDKEGSKQTVKETRDLYKGAKKLAASNNKSSSVLYTLDENGEKINFMKSIYPCIEDGNIDISRSKYKYLAAFFKYGTEFSININSRVLTFQNDNFDSLLKHVESKLARKFTKEQVLDYNKYLMSYINSKTRELLIPLTVSGDGTYVKDEQLIEHYLKDYRRQQNDDTIEVDDVAFENYYREVERRRIMGYDSLTSIHIKIEDINNISEDELLRFKKLTPAQKVEAIKLIFKDNAGVSNYLRTSLNNIKQTNNKLKGQTIRFNETNDDIEDIYDQFRTLVYSENPLLRLLAIDLLKYGFVAEGGKFRKGSISRIITNDFMRMSRKEGGIDLVANIIKTVSDLDKLEIKENKDEFTKLFVRANSDKVKQKTIYNTSFIYPKFEELANKSKDIGSLLIIPKNDDHMKVLSFLGIEIQSKKEKEEEGDENDIIDFINDTYTSKYIHLNTNIQGLTGGVLYEIVERHNVVYLKPLNKLESTEVLENSDVVENNRFYTENSYDSIIDGYDSMIEDIIDEHYVVTTEGKYKENRRLTLPSTGLQPQKHKITFSKRLLEHNLPETYFEERIDSSLEGSEYRDFITKLNKAAENNPSNVPIMIYTPSQNIAKTIKFSTIQKINGIRYSIKPVIVLSKETGLTNRRQFNKVKEIISNYNKEVKTFNKEKADLAKQELEKHREIINKDEKVKTLVDTFITQVSGLPFKTVYEAVPIPEEDYMYSMSSIVEFNDADEGYYLSTDSNNNRSNSKNLRQSDDILKSVIEFLKEEVEHGNDDVENVLYQFKSNAIDVNSSISIHKNSEFIYKTLNRYYKKKTDNLLAATREYKTRSGETFAITDEKLYEYFAYNQEEALDYARYILEGLYFGNEFDDLMYLDINGLSESTVAAINGILENIKAVKENKDIRKAIELYFNNYLAKTYSNNPLVLSNIIKLREQFGDAHFIDLHISDSRELDNKQVQLVTKVITIYLDYAKKVLVEKNIKEFQEKYNEIERRANSNGEFDLSSIIDNDKLALKNVYTDKFLEDKAKVNQDIKDQLLKLKSLIGTDDKKELYKQGREYLRKLLARDKFYIDNIHREIDKSYYEKLYNATKKAVESDAYDAMVNYQIYTIQIDELLTIPENERTEEETNKLKNLLFGRSNLSIGDDHGTMLYNEWRNIKKKLEKEYFEEVEDPAFRTELSYHLDYMSKVELEHPTWTLDYRLKDPDYKRSFDWVKTNATLSYGDEFYDMVKLQFKRLTDKDNSLMARRSDRLKRKKEFRLLMDENGVINPFNMEESHIAKIKEREQAELFAHDIGNHFGKELLIGHNTEEYYTKEFWNLIAKPEHPNKEEFAEYTRNRNEIIQKINRIVAKYYSPITKGIDFNEIIKEYSRVSDEARKQVLNELESLRELYDKLEEMQKKFSLNSDGLKSNFSDYANYSIDKDAFNDFKTARALLNPKDPDDKALIVALNNAFMTRPLMRKSYMARGLVFGKITPKDKKFINKEKTEAKKWIDQNIEFRQTEYYYRAQREARENNNYREWFEKNHVFNPITGSYQPLSIWTEFSVRESSEYAKQATWEPTKSQKERSIKEQYKNPNYRRDSDNYNEDNGGYNNLTDLTPEQREMSDLFRETLLKYKGVDRASRRFVEKGNMPRRLARNINTKFVLEQIAGGFGITLRKNKIERFKESIDFEENEPISNLSLRHITTKDSRIKEAQPVRGVDESDEEYLARVAEINELNKEIEAHNLSIEKSLIDKDWKSVMLDYIQAGTLVDAKEKLKNLAQLTYYDLKNNPAYKLSRWNKEVKIDYRESTEERQKYIKEDQNNTAQLFETFVRRTIHDSFRKESKLNFAADFLQTLTSAKYMIGNVHGGIMNVMNGMTNIVGEIYAGDYLGVKTWREGVNAYMGSSINFIKDLYSETTDDLNVGLVKMFEVVNYDDITERRPNETAGEYFKRTRDALYGLQSMGEHYMQNSVLLAILKSERIYKDHQGKIITGNFADYTRHIDNSILLGILSDNPEREQLFREYIHRVQTNKELLKHYDTFDRDIVRDFLSEIGDRKLMEEFIEVRKNKYKELEAEFNNLPLVYDQFEIKQGKAVIKEGSELTHKNVSNLAEKVKSINRKIHGVYDKVGAAKIEQEWWGRLVMQYHKHIYPGIMKRFRTNGYFNEFRQSQELGSVISFYKFVKFGVRNSISQNLKDNNIRLNKDLLSLESIITVFNTLKYAARDIKLNYNLMPEWEKRNMKRVYGDLTGIMLAIFLASCLYAAFDDDEIKNSEYLSNMIYITNRLYAETSLYTPWGLFTETKTLMSQPIAATSSINDHIKLITIGFNYLVEDEYNPYYTTGLYRGQSKAGVIISRNIPFYRVIKRLQNMTKNNKYYRVDDSALSLNFAKYLGRLHEE